MISATTLFIAGVLVAQSVEQIQPPPDHAPAGHAQSTSSDRTRITQLPPEAVAVDQPMPTDRPDTKPDAAADAARAYAGLLGTPDLGARTIVEAAVAAGLTVPPPAASGPHAAPKP